MESHQFLQLLLLLGVLELMDGFRKERLGDCSIESATAVTFSSAVLVLGRPDLLLFNADDVCQKLETQRRIVLPVGTGS